jgi:phosphohistidine phosphatase SixA
MHRRFIIMRHAKSSWDSGAEADHDRPLNDRGRRDAPRVARRLNELGWVPQFILSSDARRTRETCGLMLPEWEEGIEVDFLAALYLAGSSSLQDELPRVSDEVETLLAVGHNPGWEEVVHRLSGDSITMKTASAALMESECPTWGDAFRQAWSVVDVVHPRGIQ